MGFNRKIAEDSAKTTFVTFLVQAVSFVVSAIIAALYGATGNTDAFFYALSIVLIFTTGLTGILKAVFIPVFLRFRKKAPKEEKEILGSFYFIFTLFLLSLWALVALCSYVLFYVIGLRVGDFGSHLLGKLIIQLSFLIIFTGLVECFSTIYNSYQYFLLPLITPLFRSGIFIGFVFLTKPVLGVFSLSLGNVVGEFAQLAILFFALRAKNIYFGYKVSIHVAVKRMLRLAIPPFLSNATSRLSSFVDNTFIAPLLIGGVTILNYSNKIAAIPEMLLTGAFLTVVLSYWSLARSERGLDAVGDSLKKALIVLGFVFVPLIVYMYVLRLPLVQLLYERKNFTYDLSVSTAYLLGFFLIGILPLILGRLLTRAFLVLEDTWTPFWVGNIRFILKVITNLIFIRFFGYVGVAIATSFTSYVMFFYMLVKLRKKLVIPQSKELFSEYAKILGSGVLSGVGVFYAYKFLVLNLSGTFFYRFLALGISSFIGLGLYIFLNVIMNTQSIVLLKSLVDTETKG